MISIGIGSKIDSNELIGIANDEEHVFLVKDYEELFTKINEILKASCI